MEENTMKTFANCETDYETNELRDRYIESMYCIVTDMREQVKDIQKRVKDIEQKLVYVGATPEERKYINVDGTIKLDAISESCNNVLELFGDKYIKEVIKDGKNEGKNTTAKVD